MVKDNDGSVIKLTHMAKSISRHKIIKGVINGSQLAQSSTLKSRNSQLKPNTESPTFHCQYPEIQPSEGIQGKQPQFRIQGAYTLKKKWLVASD